MALDIAALRTEFTDLHTKATTLVEKVASEKRDFTAEEKAENETQTKRLGEIQAVIDTHKRLAGLAFTSGESVETPTTPPNKDDFNRPDIVVGETFEDRKPVKREEFRRAIKYWANKGCLPKQFAAITTATQSGIFLPIDVDQPIVATAPNVLRGALAAFGLEPMKTPSTATINIPVADANSGGVVAENATTETENEPTLTDSIKLTVKTYQSGSSWFSDTELMAVDYDLMQAILPALAYSKELAMEADVLSTIAGDSNITQSIVLAAEGAIAYDDLTNLNMALPKRYSPQRVMIVNKNVYIAAEKLKTSTGFPILNQDAQNQNLKSFNGTPVIWTDNFSTFGANNVLGCIFSWMGCRLRDAGQQEVQRYTQYPLRPAQTGYNLFGRHVFGYAPHAVALLKSPNS